MTHLEPWRLFRAIDPDADDLPGPREGDVQPGGERGGGRGAHVVRYPGAERREAAEDGAGGEDEHGVAEVEGCGGDGGCGSR